MLDRISELFPTVDIDPDAIFVQQQNLWPSAGVTTGIVARLPSSESAKASRNAPLYTEATRRTSPETVFSHSINGAESLATWMIFGDPGIATVSMTRVSKEPGATVCNVVPSTAATMPPDGLAVWHR